MAGESSPLPVSLLHELEGQREDQNARAERHHHGDHALRGAGVEAQQRPDEERRTPDESPEPAVNASTRISLLIRFNAPWNSDCPLPRGRIVDADSKEPLHPNIGEFMLQAVTA